MCRSLYFLLVLFFFLVQGSRAEEDWFPQCGQVVLVTTEGWEKDSGILSAWSRTASGWRRDLGPVPVTVGRNGLGWGVGLHPAGLTGPVKAEGDRRAPAGIFPIEFSFGKRAPATPGPVSGRSSGLLHRVARKGDLWIDDPASRHYNRWVSADSPAIRKDWNSAEILTRPDGLYDLTIVVGHNRMTIQPGKGSAIFLHRWVREGVPTIGCTAMSPENLRSLWEWLDRGKAPLLIQSPVASLRELALPAAFQSGG